MGQGNAITPVTKKTKLDEVESVMVHQLLDEVIASELNLVTDAHLKWCNIVVDGDHGQDAYHFLLKLIFTYDNNLPVEVEKWHGEVTSDKETYKLFLKEGAKTLQHQY